MVPHRVLCHSNITTSVTLTGTSATVSVLVAVSFMATSPFRMQVEKPTTGSEAANIFLIHVCSHKKKQNKKNSSGWWGSNQTDRHVSREERVRGDGGEKGGEETEKERWGRAKKKKKKKSHSASFEPVSPCWAQFDIQAMRQGSTQGGRLPLQY